MSQPYRYQHQQHQQQPPPVQEGQIPFSGGNGNPQRPPPHQVRPPFNRPPYQQQQRPQPQQQELQPQPSYRPLYRPPQPQRHPQQHPHPSPQQVQQAQQQNRPTPISQQPPVSVTQQLNSSELAPAANLFASPPAANRQLPPGPPRSQGYQPSVASNIFGVQQGRPTPQQTPQSQPSAQAILQPRAPPLQHGQLQQRPAQQQPLQRHPHHPVPTSQRSEGNEATTFGSAADLFGGGPEKATEQSLFPTTGIISTPELHQGHSNAPISGQPRGRPPPPPALQKRPSLTPTHQAPSTPPLNYQRPLVANRQQQQRPPPPPQQQQQQQQPPLSHSRQASLSTQAQPPQRSSPSALSSYGSQQQPATPNQKPLASPVIPRLGSVSNLPSGSPHTSHAQPKTPLLSAVQAASIVPSQPAQRKPSTPSLPQTPYASGPESQFGSTPHVMLQPCPFPECSGENKPQAKFCSECGRPISTASRSATPHLGPRPDSALSHSTPMASLDRVNSLFQEQAQLQPQIGQNYEQTYSQQEYSHGNQLWDTQYQQQQYDPSTGQYLDNQFQSPDHVVPEQEPEPAEPERIDDPLNRHLGCPLVAFGFGGKVVTWFPRDKQAATSTFDQGSSPLKQQHISEIALMDTRMATYPGPLLMDSSVQLKTKLEDVMKLIEHKINEYGQPHEDNIRDVHRILIWKLLKVMLEQEGTLTGGARVDEAVRSVLRSIPFANLPHEAIQQKTSEHDSASIDTLQELLRQGNLAASIRHAIDSQLWAHALVISSHGDRELWNEVVSGFVNHELSTTSGKANGRESLRVLYTIFSGQSERAVAELVPQSLRDQYLETKDDLSKRIEVPDQNLIQWRDTLTLILSNRTEGDQTIINSLGNLLRKEGWIEAAHICYLLSPQVSVHSGPDVHDTSMVFLSVDHDPHAIYPYYKNVLSFQETEVYEFGCALRNPDATEGLPFFQAYKLIYAWRLLEEGMFSEAIRYLESVENIVRSQTNGSPYYNSTFHSQLKELTERMAASVHCASAGDWLSKKAPVPVTSSIFDSSHVRADPTTIQTEQLSLGQVGQFDSAPVQVTPNVPAVTQGQTGHQSGIALTMQQHAPGYQHQHIGSYGETPGQIQAHTQYVTSESEVLPLDNPAETVPGIEKQDTGFDGSYTHYPENTGSGYDQQSSATFTSQEHQDQYQQHTEGSTMVIHETYESVQDDQEEVNAKEQATSGVDGIFGAEHNEANVQKPLEAHPAEAMSQQYAPYDQEPQHAEAVLSDEPTLEQQSVPHLPTEGDAVSSQDTWLHGHQHQGELTHGESYAVENQHQDQDGLNHGQTAYHEHIDTGYHQEQQQGAYLQSGFQQVDYQQVNSQEVDSQNVDTQQASYQQGDYQQTDQQTEYQQTEYQKTEYQQPEYQQTEYQQNEYQQSEYQKTEYQQTEYQQTEYQQTEYQQVDYQQGEYQQGGYHQYGEYHEGQYQDHHHDEHQQAEYQTNDYYQHSTSTEPGVLPVSNDEDPNPTEFQSATAAGSVQDLPEGDYEEGQFISFGAVPSFPSYGGHQQSVSPPHQQQYRQETVGEDMNDLGIGNTSLRREESVPAATSTGDGHLASGQQPTNTSGQGAQQTDEAGAGWWPKIGLFERREPTPQASVGEGSSFYYDNEQQRWINRNAASENQTDAQPLAPPPMARTLASPNPAAAGSTPPPPPAGSMPGPPQGRPAGGATVRRGARAKYVDILNP